MYFFACIAIFWLSLFSGKAVCQQTSSSCSYNKPILITSIPKSGTHLLQRCVELLTGYKRSEPETKGLNFDYIYYPKLENFEKLVLDAPEKTYRMFHLRYTKEYEKYFQEHNIKVIYIVRDPRAVLVSRVNYMRNGKCPAFRYKRWPFNLLLLSFIGQPKQEFVGIRSWDFKRRVRNTRALCNIAQLYSEFSGWLSSSWALTVSFEKLVGPQGGGNLEDQLNEIYKIAAYLEIPLTEEKALSIANDLFGKSATFLHGKIDAWKEHFLPQHRSAFKAVAPTLLQTLGYEEDDQW